MQTIQADIHKKKAELELEREKMVCQDDRERDKQDADVMLRSAEIQAKYGTQVDMASIRALMNRDREMEKMGQDQQR